VELFNSAEIRIDLKKEGNVTKGAAKKPDVTMSLTDGA
jgi:hypothetical protein